MCLSTYLEEEVFDGSGDSIDSDVEAVKVNVCVFVELLEKQVHMCPITRHPGDLINSDKLTWV